MPTKFVCLANSYKEGGRCLAGIEIDNHYNAVRDRGRPKWIRPICNTQHGQVPTGLVQGLNVLDILGVQVTQRLNNGYQSENVYFDEKSLERTGVFNKTLLNNLCSDQTKIFGNYGKAVAPDAITTLSHSLMFVKLSVYEVIERTYSDSPGRAQVRLVFKYYEHTYDLPVTDPQFLHKYKLNPDVLTGVRELFITLSLGVLHQGWYSKLVAAIIW
ncbi:MAG: hypothetical protein NTU47_04295 [Ignavibacteriales bacterium]|nr:hypothetical protein [Ignavibacteriales bacterium]